MNYFGTDEKRLLAKKRVERKSDRTRIDACIDAEEAGNPTKEQSLDLYFLMLATRLLRAKFYSSPAYTNEELSFLVDCSSGTYLALIMTRQRRCSKDLAKIMDTKLRKLEKEEGMQPIYQPEYPN